MMGDKKEREYFVQYDRSISSYLCKMLLYMSLSGPAIAIATAAGFFHMNIYQVIIIVVVVMFACLSPCALEKSGVSSSFLKYYIVFIISTLVCVIAMIPHVGIWITFILGVALSMLFLDRLLTAAVSIYSYALMLIAMYVRVERWCAAGSLIADRQYDVMTNYIGYAAGLTIEFLLVCPVFMMAVKIEREHLLREEKLFVDLSAEEERYRLALESSNDVIFEYDYFMDEFRYYGSFSRGNDDKNKCRIIEHYSDSMLAAGRVLPEDVQKVLDFKNGKTKDQFDMRLRVGEDNFYWISVEGMIVYDHSHPAKLVGKMRDITEEKKHEQKLLENSQRDTVTNFYTWDVGRRLLEQRGGKDSAKAGMMFLYLKICNMKEIDEKFGTVFSDAIVSRISEIIWELTHEEDVKIRLSRSSFTVLFKETTVDSMSLFQASLERSLQHIYTGEETASGLDYFIRFYFSLEELIAAIPEEEKTTTINNDEASEYMSDLAGFSFNILEHTRNLSSAIKMLMERIGTQFNIAYIHVFEKNTAPGELTCLYGWESSYRDSDPAQGKTLTIDRMDLDLIFNGLMQDDHLIIDNHMLIQMTDDTVEMFRNHHTSHLVVAFISDGEIVGNVVYEHLNPEYRWPEETLNSLIEVTRIMSTYILKNKSDNASRAKSDFLSSMSHEIRTPMNAIAGLSELILAENDIDDTTKHYAQDIKASTNNLLSIINDILDFSKIESGKFEIIPEKYAVSSVLYDVSSIVKLRLENKKAAFRVVFENNIPEGLLGDASRVRQILLNLLSNAVKFTEHGEITLSLRWETSGQDKGTLHAAVRDTGIGIRKEDIGRLFNSFSQVDTVRNKSITGTGLGLAICKNLCHLMGGEISVTSVYGEGSTFSFYLPQGVYDSSPCVFDVDDMGWREGEDVFKVPFYASRAKLLVVDDNKVNIEVAKGLLKQYRAQVFTASSGSEAIEMFRKDPDYNIIFMDHMMPKMDGIEAASIIRKLDIPQAAGVTIVALTANAIKGADRQFINAGMNDYIPKPIELRVLAKVMSKWIPDNLKEEVQETDETGIGETAMGDDVGRISETGEGFEKLSGINVKAGLKNCMDDRETYIDLLRTFVETGSMKAADEYYDADDIENYKITVHGMKSAANYIGAEELSKYAKRLEEYAKKDDIESIHDEHEGLRPLYDNVTESIIAAFGAESESENANREMIDREQLTEILEKLRTDLDDMNFDEAGKDCGIAASYRFSDEDVMSLINEANRDIDNFDFDEADEKIKNAISKLAD